MSQMIPKLILWARPDSAAAYVLFLTIRSRYPTGV
jgi:hypothetical protein